MVAVGAVDGDEEAEAVLAADGVEGGPRVHEDVVQERARAGVLPTAAGGALEGDLGAVLGPGEQIGHRQPGRSVQVAGEDEFRRGSGGRTGSCEGPAHGLPPPA
ncbi:hypothetical protein GCM10010276_40730 [Streptomyces longisporus]|uniref:Uncharacterized protein n=1 Tax=Streptomyces longisporus TaxID=1948 RepID=A0ABP5ZBQ1_STRLO